MKSKLIVSILVLVLALGGVLGATSAYFSDFSTSTGNTFTAGKLDLQINGKDGNVSLFDVEGVTPQDFGEGVVPTSHLSNSFDITNVGNINGYLNIKRVVVTNLENGCIDPEIKFGDIYGDDVGELGGFLNVKIFFDVDKDGVLDTGETVIYDGRINKLTEPATLASLSTINKLIPAGASATVVGVITDWWRANDSSEQWGNYGNNDNKAQTDKVIVDLVFTLDQTNDTRQGPDGNYTYQNGLPEDLPENLHADEVPPAP